MVYLLDTNTLIYFFKGMGNVADLLLSKPPRDIAIPSIVLYELEVGIAKSTEPEKRESQLALLVSKVTVEPFGKEAAKESARLRANLEAKGTPIGHYDTLIAGIGLSLNAVLVTHNTKEFRRVDGLSVEDWY